MFAEHSPEQVLLYEALGESELTHINDTQVMDIKRQINSNTVPVGNINTLLISMDKSFRKKKKWHTNMCALLGLVV